MIIEKNNLPEGWFSPNDIKEYRNFYNNLPNNSFTCELGCWKGRSICSVADIILNKNLTVYCVDTFEGTVNEGDAHKEAKDLSLKAVFKLNLKRFNIDKNVIILNKTTDEAFEQDLKNKVKFDLILVDADHSREAVSKDTENYSSILNKNSYSFLIGHDFSWESVRLAISSTLKNSKTLVQHNNENMWWINAKDIELKTDDMSVTAVICTKDRYDLLYSTIICIANQTIKPEKLLIFDDSNNKKDLREEQKWKFLFTLLQNNNIPWEILLTEKNGQNKNHQLSIDHTDTKYIWRVDDDLIFGNNVLENLKNSLILYDSQVVGPKVITPDCNIPFSDGSPSIKDVFTKVGLQLTDGNGIHEVDHLHCTFLYDRTLGIKYHSDLSIVGHREETIFSYRFKKKNYKVIVNLDTEVYHIKSPTGGIRSLEVTENMYLEDEEKFKLELNSEELKKDFFIYLDNGLGDHFIFKHLLKNIVDNNEKVVISCCYPKVFWEYLDKVTIISIEEGKKILSAREETTDDYSVYRLMDTESSLSEEHVIEAFKRIYEKETVKEVKKIEKKEEYKPKIIDCFPFFNEFEILKIRLEELYDYVDYFVITEGNLTHSGKEKPLYLTNKIHDKEFDKYRDKIIVQAVNLKEDITDWAPDSWKRERKQRNDAIITLKMIAKDEDFVIFSDADEIPRVSAIQEYISDTKNHNKLGVLLQDRFMYHFNNKKINSDTEQSNSVMCTYQFLKQYDEIAEFRYWKISVKGLPYYIINNGGWHFTFLGNEEQIKNKIQAFAHTEFDKNEILDSIHENYLLGKDFYTSYEDWEIVPIDESFPKEIQKIASLGLSEHILYTNCIKHSIIIGTYNHLEDLLIPCVESILKNTDMSNKELIIVANGCTDDTADYLFKLHLNNKNIVPLIFKEPLGFPKAYNIGISKAKGDKVVLLNNDTILYDTEKKDTWINLLDSPFKDLEVGITGPSRLWSDEIQDTFLVFFCVMIDKKVITKIGMLNEDFGVGSAEDIDFCIKAKNAGFKLIQVPSDDQLENDGSLMLGGFPIYHVGEGTMRDIENWQEIYSNNQKLLKQKYDNTNIPLLK